MDRSDQRVELNTDTRERGRTSHASLMYQLERNSAILIHKVRAFRGTLTLWFHLPGSNGTGMARAYRRRCHSNTCRSHRCTSLSLSRLFPSHCHRPQPALRCLEALQTRRTARGSRSERRRTPGDRIVSLFCFGIPSAR